MGFASSRSILLEVSNPDDLPGLWKIRETEIPFFHHSSNGDLIFGISAVAQNDSALVYGVREDWRRGAGGRSVILAKMPVEALHDRQFSAWRFFSGGEWSPDLSKATALFDGGGAEMSVSYVPAINEWAAVYSPPFSPKIVARFAPRPEGPWGQPELLYSCPEVTWNARYGCYAGKAHPELARTPNDLIVTYASNSSDFGDHLRDLRLYWPRFVKVSMNRREHGSQR